MPGSNTYCRTTAKLFTEFSYYSPVYASTTDALGSENFIDMSVNVSGDDNTIYGLVTHPLTAQNEVYDSSSDATGLNATLYMLATLEQPNESGSLSSVNTWIQVGEPISVTPGSLFKIEHLRAAVYALCVTGSAEGYAVNVSYQYEPMKVVWDNKIKYTDPQRYYAEPNYDIQSNSINNIGEYNTKAIDSTNGNTIDLAPNV